MSTQEWLVLWRDLCVGVTWVAAVLFFLGGLDDLIYDFGSWGWKILKRHRYGDREPLSLAKLRARAQQRIAVFIPAWNESHIVGKMVENILTRVEYRNFTIFVGTYPNDPATQHAVDELALVYPQVVKVVNDQPGPTSKADCLNTVYRTMLEFETQQAVNFDLMVMHDAEDLVHPFSLLLYNYLIPRVDVIQLPILALPTAHLNWVHWTYADEFVENHLKDLIVREKMAGFVPFAGVGTGFSRRALSLLHETFGPELFNESSLTEDYSLGKKIHAAGLQAIFVNIVLPMPEDRWYTPLAARHGFIANWAYFPMDFARSIRQKTRWIIGISLQEWERSGWVGSWPVKLNLFKDRKIFFAAATTLLGYTILGYFVLWEMGHRGWLPFKPIAFIHPGTPLYTLVLIDTGFMLLRLVERLIFVTWVYGPIAGLLALPRTVFSNVLNGLAAYRALSYYAQARNGQRRLGWDKTEHKEGVGEHPARYQGALPNKPSPRGIFNSVSTFETLQAAHPATILASLETIPRHVDPPTQLSLTQQMASLAQSSDYEVRAAVARVSGFLQWASLYEITLALLYDREWLVRANAAKALLRYPDLPMILRRVLDRRDSFAWEVFIRTFEQSHELHEPLLRALQAPEEEALRLHLLAHSPLLTLKYHKLTTPPQPTRLDENLLPHHVVQPSM